MSTIIETDLKEVLGQINNKLEKIADDVTEIKIKVAKLEHNQENFNKRLDAMDKRFDSVDKRFDEVNSRLNTLTLGFLGIVGVLVAGLLTILGKISFFPNP